jgi:HD superfamily phosphohydrolase
MNQKLFRDPIYDYILIDQKQKWLLDLVNCPEVQRLRYIKQLGLCSYTYPGSTHTRFAHCLGVLHLMSCCINYLKQDYDSKFKQLEEEALLAAALLHDVCHGPLSHATEKIFGDHEERTVQIIIDPDSQVNKALKKRAPSLPDKVADLIKKKSKASLWQKSLISSQLDMDRLDYLRRDALCSGAEYGNFDSFRIIHTIQLQEFTEERQKGIFVVWPEKTKYALEEYIFSRFYMYQSVYFHHTTRGFECLLRKILLRAQELGKKDTKFATDMLPPMKMLLGGRHHKNLRSFQQLTDGRRAKIKY